MREILYRDLSHGYLRPGTEEIGRQSTAFQGFIREMPDHSRARLQQHQIVPMDHLVASAPAQDRLDLIRPMPGNARRVLAGIGR
jgi:hypothetical protein